MPRMQDLTSFARQFRQFAQTERGEASLYRRLASGVTGDPDLLALAVQGQG